MTSRKIRVLHVDDSAVERRLFALLIRMESDLELAAGVADTAGLAEAVRATRPDVLVLDLGLTVSDPLAAIRDVRQGFPDLGILVYSGYGIPETIAAARAAGATDYVVKATEIQTLVAAIRRAAARERSA